MLILSPLHGLGACQLLGEGVADAQHVGATVGQGALLIQHQPVGNTREELSVGPLKIHDIDPGRWVAVTQT